MKKGFTLIEIMVAVSIFTVVAMITTGALITISDVNRKAQAIKIAMDNVSFAMDSMVTNLREGAQFSCLTDTSILSATTFNFDNATSYLGDSCTNGGGIIFKPKRAESTGYIVYRFFEDTNGRGSIQKASGSTGSSSYVNLTSLEVDIAKLSFSVPDVTSSTKKPTVTMVINGEIPGKTPTKFNLQTTTMANF